MKIKFDILMKKSIAFLVILVTGVLLSSVYAQNPPTVVPFGNPLGYDRWKASPVKGAHGNPDAEKWPGNYTTCPITLTIAVSPVLKKTFVEVESLVMRYRIYVSIYDVTNSKYLMGYIILEGTMGNININMSSYPEGEYILEFKDTNGGAAHYNLTVKY